MRRQNVHNKRFSVILLFVPLLLCFNIVCPLCLYVILASVPLLLCLLHTLSLMSLCHSGFCSSVTMSLHTLSLMSLCHSGFCSSVTMSLHTLSLMSLCHSGFINVKYFYKLPILSVTCEWQVGQYLPFLSHTFRDEFVSIKKTIVYKIK